MGETLRILQQNLDWQNENIEKLMDTLLEKNPQVLLFSEFCYSTYTPKKEQKAYEVNHKDKIVKRLSEEGYDFYWPYACTDPERPEDLKKCRNGLICAMAVKANEATFTQRERRNIILSGRYIEGSLRFRNRESIEILFIWAPQTVPDLENIEKDYGEKTWKNFKSELLQVFFGNQKRVEQKVNMICEACHFLAENNNKKVFIGGDFNTEIGGNTSCEDTFKLLCDNAKDTTTNHKPTWENYERRLDYALVSASLSHCGCNTISLETTSDHKALLTEITLD